MRGFLRTSRELPPRTNEVARVAVGIPLEVVLVLGLGLPERSGGLDFGNDLSGPQAGRVDIGDRVLRDAALLVIDVEDRRAVAGAQVVALTVLRSRVVDLEEELEQVPVGDAVRIEHDLDRLGMRAVVAISRVRNVAPRVANPRADDAVELADQILDAPEAPTSKDRRLGLSHVLLLLVGFLSSATDAL